MQYLQGKNLHRTIEYRICLLLAKWFYSQGIASVTGIREKIFDWAKENDFYITKPINPIATRVLDGKMQLLGQEPIYVNQKDIQIILDKFDTYYERKIALGILCYSKSYSENGGFSISQAMLARWVGMTPTTIRKHINTLLYADFLVLADNGSTSAWYDNVVSEIKTYHLCFETRNTGNYQLLNNDLDALYEDIFEPQNVISEQWYSIDGYCNWYEVSSEGRVRVKQREINGRVFPEKILRIFKSTSGKSYVNLFDDKTRKQRKVSVDALLADNLHKIA